MAAEISKGWLSVPFAGDEVVPSYIRVGDGDWVPAYLDWNEAGQRVAKIRPPLDLAPGVLSVTLRNGYQVTPSGAIRV